MTSCPLDILRTRDVITADQHAAGIRFGRLHRLFYGATEAKAAVLAERIAGDGQAHDPADEVWLSRQRDRLRECEQAMRRISRRTLDDVVNVVAYHRMPSWVFRPDDGKAVGVLRDGLDALALALGITGARKAA